MPIALDIAGNFGKGAQVRHTARLARQIERSNDIDLANAADKLGGRRDSIRQAEEIYGMDPYNFDQFGDFQTNGDPLYLKFANWWKQRRALRQNGRSMQATPELAGQGDAMGGPPPTPLEEIPGYYNDGGKVRAIPSYADGGVADEDELARRRRLATQSMSEESRARRAAEFRRQGISTTTSQTGRGGAIPRESLMRRTTNALRGRGASAAGRARGVGAGATIGLSAIVPQLTDENYDETMNKRFGFEEGNVQPGVADGQDGTFISEDAGDASLGGFLKYFGKRALGYASDVGSALTFGMADNLYRDRAIPQPAGKEAEKPAAQAAQPEAPPQTPVTPDEATAQAAKSDGQRMLQEADAANAPPGAIDFSKVNVPPSEIPAMPVKDWVEYRGRAVRNAMLQGASPTEAHAQVSQLQMKGFQDYMQQALFHLEGGNPLAAASAARAAYQYFPNGSDVRIGVTKGVDGNPVLVAMGTDEETGEPKGSPQVLNSERIGAFINQAGNPAAWNAWTKDWRDERFEHEKQDFTRQKTERELAISERNARSNELQAQAQMTAARRPRSGEGRDQTDYDRANAAFVKASEMLALTDQAKADRLTSIMAQIYEQADWQYPQVIEFVREADARGQLEELAQRLGVE